MCGGVDIYRDICEVLVERFSSRCLQESLCSSCAQIDQVAVTCNESLALSIMSALLDKSLHFQRICPIASNKRGRTKARGRGGGGESPRLLTSASSLEQPGHQTACVRLAFLLVHWEWSGLFTGPTTITLLYQSLLYAVCDQWQEEKWPLGFLHESEEETNVDFKNRSARSEIALSPLQALYKISNTMLYVLYSINKKGKTTHNYVTNINQRSC